MITPLLLLFVAVCGLLLLQGMRRRGAIYEYPFLAGAVFTGFALPQFVGLARDPFLPQGALEATLTMAILCAVMCWLGAAMAGRPNRVSSSDLDEKRLLVAGGVLSLAGAYFYYRISQLPPEILKAQWTGMPVAYLFFARMLTYGFAIAVLLVARNGSRTALLLAFIDGAFYLDRIVIGGRRQDLVEFATIILLAWWFQRDRCLPRPLMLVGLILGALFINSVGDYRSATTSDDGPQWDAVFNIDFVGNFEHLTEEGGAELTNAVYIIGDVNRTMNFDVGAYHWNALIFSYVPAQLVGADFKNALYLPSADPATEEYLWAYTPIPGSTPTGVSDAFQSFWYFGCAEFFLIAFIMQKLWYAARNSNLTAQLLYMLLPAPALEAITHTTHYFVAPWVHMALFLAPALILARRRRERREAPVQSAMGGGRSPAAETTKSLSIRPA